MMIPELHPDEAPGDRSAWRVSLPPGPRLVERAHALLERLGQVLDTYGSGTLWNPLEVRLDVPAMRTHGTGTNPLHVDYINRRTPPPWIALLGVRQDPHQGGQTMLGDLAAARASVSPEDQAWLERRTYAYWNDEGAREVGPPLEAFSVWPTDDAYTRFTAKMIPHLDAESVCLTREARPDHEAIRGAMARFHAALGRHTWRHRLRPGELLVFDQRRWVHGRQALGPGQDRLAPDARRLLMQAYLRRPGDPNVAP